MEENKRCSSVVLSRWWRDLSMWMWLRSKVWAFFSHFPTTDSEMTAETRHCVSASPTVSTYSHWQNVSQRCQRSVLSFNCILNISRPLTLYVCIPLLSVIWFLCHFSWSHSSKIPPKAPLFTVTVTLFFLNYSATFTNSTLFHCFYSAIQSGWW